MLLKKCKIMAFIFEFRRDKTLSLGYETDTTKILVMFDLSLNLKHTEHLMAFFKETFIRVGLENKAISVVF